MIEEIRTLIDTSTGEVYNTRKRQFNVFDENKGYYFRYNSNTIKQYADTRLSTFITDRKDFMRVHLLAEYIYKGTNELMIRESTRKIRYMTDDDISTIIELCERKTKLFINRMIKMEIMARRITQVGEAEFTVYVMNPLFFNYCKYISPSLYFLFESSLKPYIPQYVRDWYNEVGNIAKEGDSNA